MVGQHPLPHVASGGPIMAPGGQLLDCVIGGTRKEIFQNILRVQRIECLVLNDKSSRLVAKRAAAAGVDVCPANTMVEAVPKAFFDPPP